MHINRNSRLSIRSAQRVSSPTQYKYTYIYNKPPSLFLSTLFVSHTLSFLWSLSFRPFVLLLLFFWWIIQMSLCVWPPSIRSNYILFRCLSQSAFFLLFWRFVEVIDLFFIYISVSSKTGVDCWKRRSTGRIEKKRIKRGFLKWFLH